MAYLVFSGGAHLWANLSAEQAMQDLTNDMGVRIEGFVSFETTGAARVDVAPRQVAYVMEDADFEMLLRAQALPG